MNRTFFILPLLAIFAAPAWAQLKPVEGAVQTKIQVDPKAVALLDKAAAHYKSVKTLKLVAQGSSVWDGETMPNRLTLFFERPNKIRVQGESDGTKGVLWRTAKHSFCGTI